MASEGRAVKEPLPGAEGSSSNPQTGSLKASDADSEKKLARSKSNIPSSEKKYRERVLVRVYDLGQTVVTRGLLNRVTQQYGAFHTGVEVYGREWSFGMTFDDMSTGITWNPPGQNCDHSFRETLSMGFTSLSPSQVLRLIEGMKYEWRGCTYNLLTRNCHHFSDVFCQRLGALSLPSWVNTLATSGAGVAEWVDSADSGYDGGEALQEFLGSIWYNTIGALIGSPAPSPAPAGPRKAPSDGSKARNRRLIDGSDPFLAAGYPGGARAYDRDIVYQEAVTSDMEYSGVAVRSMAFPAPPQSSRRQNIYQDAAAPRSMTRDGETADDSMRHEPFNALRNL